MKTARFAVLLSATFIAHGLGAAQPTVADDDLKSLRVLSTPQPTVAAGRSDAFRLIGFPSLRLLVAWAPKYKAEALDEVLN